MTVNHKVIIEKIGIAFLLTVTAYFVAYIFEVGYLRSSGISWQTARVTIPSLVISFMGIVFLGSCLRYAGFIFVDVPRNKKSETGKFIYMRVVEYFILFALVLLLSLVSTGKIYIEQSAAVALLLPMLNILIWLLFNFRPLRRPFKKMLVESFKAFNRDYSEFLKPRGFAKSNVMKAYNWILITTMIIFSLSYVAGYYASMMIRPSRAFVLDNSRYAVIRDYDGVVVAKEIVEGRIGEKYMYIDPSQNKLIFYPIRINKGVIQ